MAPQVQARRLLNLFQFPAARWNDRVGRLSGGEKRRLQLLKVLAINPNFLVLDEPTNDLDILSLQILEDFLLNDYKGCLVIVSHDRSVFFEVIFMVLYGFWRKTKSPFSFLLWSSAFVAAPESVFSSGLEGDYVSNVYTWKNMIAYFVVRHVI